MYVNHNQVLLVISRIQAMKRHRRSRKKSWKLREVPRSFLPTTDKTFKVRAVDKISNEVHGLLHTKEKNTAGCETSPFYTQIIA